MIPGVAGAVAGGMAAGGLRLAVTQAPPRRRARLEDRLGPYLRDAPGPSRLLAVGRPPGAFPTLQRLVGPALTDLAGRVDRALGGGGSVRRRLTRASSGRSLEEFRSEQVVWAFGGLLVGLVVAVLAAGAGSATASPVGVLVVAGGFAVSGALARDRWLTVQVRRREERMLAELPTVAELLALAVTAGESAVGALERVARLCAGELAGELAGALADARAGAGLVSALEQMAGRTELSALTRFVDGIAIALDRGTPLAEVLRAQAVDVREAGRRALLEAGGRREIAMMLPVVFLVLPVTIIFALFPAFYSISLSVP